MFGLYHPKAINIHNGNGFLMSNGIVTNLLTTKATVRYKWVFPKQGGKGTYLLKSMDWSSDLIFNVVSS